MRHQWVRRKLQASLGALACLFLAGCAGRNIVPYDDDVADVSLPAPYPAPRQGPDVEEGTVTAPSRPAHEKLTTTGKAKVVSDDRLRTDVLAAIVDDPAIDPFQFRYVVEDGKVEVRGDGSQRQKDRVGETVSRVRGVRGVENEVETPEEARLSEEHPVSDEEIEKNLTDAIERDPMADFSKVKISSDEGVVTLGGAVPNLRTAWQIERHARDLKGVKDVVNQMSVKPRYLRDDRRLVRDVKAAIALDSRLNDEQIEVSSHSGVIELTGIVSASWKKDRAAELGSEVFGVQGIHNSLEVARRG